MSDDGDGGCDCDCDCGGNDDSSDCCDFCESDDDDDDDNEGEEGDLADYDVDLRLVCACCCSNWFFILSGIGHYTEKANHAVGCDTKCFFCGLDCRCNDNLWCCFAPHLECCEKMECYARTLSRPWSRSLWGALCGSCQLVCASALSPCCCSPRKVPMACAVLGWTCWPVCGCCVEDREIWKKPRDIPFLPPRQWSVQPRNGNTASSGLATTVPGPPPVQAQAMSR